MTTAVILQLQGCFDETFLGFFRCNLYLCAFTPLLESEQHTQGKKKLLFDVLCWFLAIPSSPRHKQQYIFSLCSCLIEFIYLLSPWIAGCHLQSSWWEITQTPPEVWCVWFTRNTELLNHCLFKIKACGMQAEGWKQIYPRAALLAFHTLV